MPGTSNSPRRSDLKVVQTRTWIIFLISENNQRAKCQKGAWMGLRGRIIFTHQFNTFFRVFCLKPDCIQSTFILLGLQDSSAHRRQEMHLNLQETQGYRGDYIPYFLECCLNSRRDPALQSLANTPEILSPILNFWFYTNGAGNSFPIIKPRQTSRL